jgi:hypothetical protein
MNTKVTHTTPADGWFAVFRGDDDGLPEHWAERIAFWVTYISDTSPSVSEHHGVVNSEYLDDMADSSPQFLCYAHESELALFGINTKKPIMYDSPAYESEEKYKSKTTPDAHGQGKDGGQ